MRLEKRTLHDAQRGFTIVELLVVIVIVSILASATLPLARMVSKRNQEAELRRALREIRTALDNYKQAADARRIAISVEDSGYPPNLDILSNGVTDIQSPTAQKIYFLRRVPRDPLQADVTLPASATWGKRSYASTAQESKEGRDVFDVYSKSTDVGLNGIAYRNW